MNILNLRRFLPPQMLSPRFAPSKMDLGPSVFPEQHITKYITQSPALEYIIRLVQSGIPVTLNHVDCFI